MTSTATAQSAAISVSKALSIAKDALESITLRLVGEVSEVSCKPGYKAVYFSVKDAKATLPCMMWNNRYAASDVELRVGMLVELTGRFSLYAAKGRMSFDVQSLSPAGEGVLRMQVAALARALQAEGFMDPQRKRVLPPFPSRIGLVTSPRGAAVHDVLRTLRRRFPLATVLLAGVPVEGAQAHLRIAEGIECAANADADVILVVRGGGSFEDLMPFNSEAVARAIARSPVPVITGIGHEPDTTISDMVADVRASTPTAAAEAVSPDMSTLVDTLDSFRLAMNRKLRFQIEREELRLAGAVRSGVLSDPNRVLSPFAQALDDASVSLSRAIPHSFELSRQRLNRSEESIRSSMGHGLRMHRSAIEMGRARFKSAGGALLRDFDSFVGLNAARLHDLSPLSSLARGYTIAKSEDGSIVKSSRGLEQGDILTVMFHDGEVGCTVDKVNADNT